MHCELDYTKMSFDTITSGQLWSPGVSNSLDGNLFLFYYQKAFQFSKSKSDVNTPNIRTNGKIATGRNFVKTHQCGLCVLVIVQEKRRGNTIV